MAGRKGEPMRLIDADRLLEDKRIGKYYHLKNGDIAIPLIDIKHAPTIEERKTGKWNAYYHGINETPSFTYSCNQCGYSAPYGLYGGKYSQKEWNFCPNCGADMRGEQDE